MNSPVPPAVLARSPGSFLVHAGATAVALYLRELRYGETKYPRHCPLEVRLCRWDHGGVLLVAVLARLNRSDLTTFDDWINPGLPEGVRCLKLLAVQKHIDVHIVTDQVDRSLRTANTLAAPVAGLLHELRDRQSWTPQQFADEKAKIERLYPTSKAMWWADREE